MKKFKLFTAFGIDTMITSQYIVFMLIVFILSFLANLKKGILLAIHDGLTTNALIIFSYIFVIIHEYGHALSAKKLGYKTKDIALYPMAGIATVSGDWHKNAWHEYFITIYGPLCNSFLAIVFIFFNLFLDKENVFYAFFDMIIHINFMLFLFNMIPIYPMDGGRLLRSLLNYITKDWWKSTIYAHRIAVALSLIILPFSFYYNQAILGILISYMGCIQGSLEVQSLKSEKDLEDCDRKLSKAINDVICQIFDNLKLEYDQEYKNKLFKLIELFVYWSLNSNGNTDNLIFGIVLIVYDKPQNIDDLLSQLQLRNDYFEKIKVSQNAP